MTSFVVGSKLTLQYYCAPQIDDESGAYDLLLIATR
jgi:hypothetical protein